jgi:IclR family KDG regulon transcriptional repressor
VIRAHQSKSAPVGVVAKLLRILEALDGSPAGLQLREISRQTGIHKSTAYRFLAHLESEGYLLRSDAGAYIVGPKLARLGAGLAYHETLRELSRPVIQNIWRITGETVNLAALDGQDVLYLDVLESAHSFRMVSPVGMRRPPNCTALGKAMLAYLPAEPREALVSSLTFERFTPHTLTSAARLKKELAKVRLQGYALDDQETDLGARCVAAPIIDASGKVTAAISVSGPITRINRDRIRSFIAAVKEGARAISSRLGYSEMEATG